MPPITIRLCGRHRGYRVAENIGKVISPLPPPTTFIILCKLCPVGVTKLNYYELNNISKYVLEYYYRFFNNCSIVFEK